MRMIDDMIRGIVATEMEKVITLNAILDCVLCIVARKTNVRSLQCDPKTGEFRTTISKTDSSGDTYTLLMNKEISNDVVKVSLVDNNRILAGCVLDLRGNFRAEYGRIPDRAIRNFLHDIFNEIEDLPSSVVQEVVDILTKTEDDTAANNEPVQETPVNNEQNEVPEEPKANQTPPLTSSNIPSPTDEQPERPPSIFDSEIYQKMLNNPKTEPPRTTFAPNDVVSQVLPSSLL